MENEYKDLLNKIKENETYNLILKDSFGGIMYNTANKGKYKDEEIKKLFAECEKLKYIDYFDGITKGVFDFLKEECV